ncbi:hypothetical protein BX666DRAFT_1862202 [Dichotomocladium elegans]|nr:hypothetical protein BX666DRAFT_1862202 [Dichotomocladium elegans]
MDPGYNLLQHIKTIPNLINEDPSIVTPKNTSFMDLPWSDFSKLLSNHKPSQSGDLSKRRASSSSIETASTVSSSETETELGNWDSMTGYQDLDHTVVRYV